MEREKGKKYFSEKAGSVCHVAHGEAEWLARARAGQAGQAGSW